jgi:transcriptional regulator with XRE-family HTH domain
VEQYTTNFGARLRALISRKGISIAQFADAFEVSESQVHNWLKRQAPPLEKHWIKLAEYFGVSTDYIAFGTPNISEQVNQVFEERPADKPESGPKFKFLHPDYPEDLTAADQLKQGIELHMRGLMEKAGSDPGRLGYIFHTLEREIPIPSSWLTGDEALKKAREIETLLSNYDMERRQKEKPSHPHTA